MSKGVQIAVITSIGLGIAVATFLIIRGIKKEKGKENSGDDGGDGGKNNSETKPKEKEPKYDPSADAKELHRSMNGGGTYEDVFWRVTNKLTSAQKSMVKEKFNSTYGNLKDWIEGDFSWSAETRALKSWGY